MHIDLVSVWSGAFTFAGRGYAMSQPSYYVLP